MSTNWVRLDVLMRSDFMPRESSRSGNDEVRAGVLQTGMPFDFVEGRLAPASGERQETEFPRLQGLVRVNKVRQKFLMRRDGAGFAVKRTANHLLQLFGLIFDLVLGGFDRGPERRV